MRLKEVERAGFKTCFIPEGNIKEVDKSFKFDIRGFSALKDLVADIF
jgi:predicted ATP-dependent serine protease